MTKGYRKGPRLPGENKKPVEAGRAADCMKVVGVLPKEPRKTSRAERVPQFLDDVISR